MNINEIRGKSSDELCSLLSSFRADLISMLFENKMKKNNNYAYFASIRKDIARVLTVLNERKGVLNV